MTRSMAIFALTASAVLLSGCGALRGAACSDPAVYSGARSRPPLQIPAGLEAPDTTQALRIPAVNDPEQPVPANSCLESPPRYTVPRPQPDA